MPKTEVFEFDPNEEAINLDWMRAVRLMKRAEAGDEDAAKELEELREQKTVIAEDVD